MIVKLEFDEYGDAFLPIPETVLEQLNLTVGDHVHVDVDMIRPDTLIVWKKETE